MGFIFSSKTFEKWYTFFMQNLHETPEGARGEGLINEAESRHFTPVELEKIRAHIQEVSPRVQKHRRQLDASMRLGLDVMDRVFR